MADSTVANWITYDAETRPIEASMLLNAEVVGTSEGPSLTTKESVLSVSIDRAKTTDALSIASNESLSTLYVDTNKAEEGRSAVPASFASALVSENATTNEGSAGSIAQSQLKTIADRVEVQYTEPTHRWQMPLPRNILTGPENFDPAESLWRIPPLPSVGVDTNALLTQSGVDVLGTESGDILEFE
jgi:hypothetical protein